MQLKLQPYQLLFQVFLLLPFLSVAQKGERFTLMKPSSTGVKFINKVEETDSLHVFKYEYLYNGHGVGIADFNNDGLPDLFFSGNAVPNKLYLNKGNFQFEEVSIAAGIEGDGTWATGVSVVDINGDGFMDVYVCHSGYFSDSNRLRNKLYVHSGNQGVPVFQERAAQFGLDAPGTQSTQAAFFDYDLDGDLDMFLLNHSNHTYNPFLNTRKQRAIPDFHFGNRLFRNDNNGSGKTHFTDVTLSAGIINNALNFGLGVVVSDLNNDGWPDIYTTSDYTEQDYYYVNNRNGTFSQSLQKSFAHISRYSMGADIADYNNDGLPDVLTLDMLPEDNYRQKLLKGPDEYDQYHLLIDSGYYHQQMRNMLQLNRGVDQNGNVRFSEIGQFANISNTDWSWAGLFADLDNDGWKDLLVTNGYLRDYTDLDFMKYTVADAQVEQLKQGNMNFKTYDLVKKMPSNKPANYVFKNSGDLKFQDVSKLWGFDAEAISNGAAYADLDNDGDLDIVICNNNSPVMLYRNNSSQDGKHFLKVKLRGNKFNSAGIGSQVWVYTNKGKQLQEFFPVRGYQSSMSTALHFGLGDVAEVDSLIVRWPGGSATRLTRISSDTILQLKEEDAHRTPFTRENIQTVFTEIAGNKTIPFKHRENDFIDFKDEVLLPYQLSKMGPAIASADVNKDGLPDIFLGGAIGQSGKLFLQEKNGSFREKQQEWLQDSVSEDVNAIFFDANGDGFADLYVVSGGNEYLDDSPEFNDRIYLNDGKGNFKKTDALPAMSGNKQAIATVDYDGDGDLDIFVGGGVLPGSFPRSSRSYLLRNDSEKGSLKFVDVTSEIASELTNPGMVMAAAWADIDKDGKPELMLAGDWMQLKLFKFESGAFKDISKPSGLDKTDGLWSSMVASDVDLDGDMDFVLGNCGLNNQFRSNKSFPGIMYSADFDDNGTIDPIITYAIKGKYYPLPSRDELLDQIVPLRKKFISYKSYAAASIDDIFGKEKVESATKNFCYEMQSGILINTNGQFEFRPFPSEAQFSKVNGILVDDFDKDGRNDILLSGNFYANRVQLGRYDASLGLLLKGDGRNNFVTVPQQKSGLYIDGDARNLVSVESGKNEKIIVIAINDDFPAIIRHHQ